MSKKLVRSAAGIMLSLMMVLSLCLGCFSMQTEAASGGFQVSGTKLYDANGNEFVMRGVNYPHAWYTSQYATAIPAIADYGFNTVRLVLANGKQYSKTSYSELSALIDICKQNNLVAIVEIHDATGSDSTYDLDQAVNYWIEMKDLLIGNEAYVIINIANEWYGTWDNGSTWKSGNISAIQSLRNAGIKNTLMVDCAGWGQYPQVIFDHGQAVLAADTLGNTMFSIHMYEYAGGNESTVKNNIDNVLNKNLCLAIGEFGGYHSNGDVDEQTIMSYSEQKNVSWLAWSWTGNSSNLSYLDLTYDFAGSSLTEFGNTVINGANGIKQTSEVCSVFGGNTGGGNTSGGSNDNTGDSGNTGGSDNTGSDDNTGDSGNDSAVSGTTNIFYGSASTSGWGQAVSVSTPKNGGNANVADMQSGDFIWVEYTNSYNDFDLIFQSWSGGANWAKISPSENGTTSNGTNYAKFYYDDIVSVYGSNFSTVDMVHIGAHSGSLTVKSVDIVFDEETSGNTGNSGTTEDSGNTGNSGTTEDSGNTGNSGTTEDSGNTDNSGNEGSSAGVSHNVFWGSASTSNWGQAVSISTSTSGGSAVITDMGGDDFVWVEYTGSYGELELIFQSWSGGEGWAKISPSELGTTSTGTYYAKFYYNDIVNAYGSYFGNVDRIHVGACNSSITVKSVDLVK